MLGNDRSTAVIVSRFEKFYSENKKTGLQISKNDDIIYRNNLRIKGMVINHEIKKKKKRRSTHGGMR